eukprot:SAG31_NODE_11068_length_1069_cov_1.979381_1_plen_141_part_10
MAGSLHSLPLVVRPAAPGQQHLMLLARVVVALALLLLAGSSSSARWTVCFDPVDSTACLEAALAAPGVQSIYLPAAGHGVYVTARPLVAQHSNQEIVLAAGVVIEAKAGAFVGYNDCLLRVGAVSNVTVRGERQGQRWPPA